MSGLLRETSSENRLLGGKYVKSTEVDDETYLNKIELDISRRGVQFLAPESLCNPSYEGLKDRVSHGTIMHISTSKRAKRTRVNPLASQLQYLSHCLCTGLFGLRG